MLGNSSVPFFFFKQVWGRFSPSVEGNLLLSFWSSTFSSLWLQFFIVHIFQVLLLGHNSKRVPYLNLIAAMPLLPAVADKWKQCTVLPVHSSFLCQAVFPFLNLNGCVWFWLAQFFGKVFFNEPRWFHVWQRFFNGDCFFVSFECFLYVVCMYQTKPNKKNGSFGSESKFSLLPVGDHPRPSAGQQKIETISHEYLFVL